MFDSIFKSVLSLAITCTLMFLIVSNRAAIYAMAGLAPVETSAEAPVQVATPVQAETLKTTSSGGRVTIKKNPRDGQFWTEARINNRTVTVLVDTGASSVALTPEDAKRAGIKLRSLDYNIPINTAGGQVMAARVTLKSVKVGSIRVKNVRGIVIPNGLSISLLGMTYLGEIKKIQVTPDAMVLKN